MKYKYIMEIMEYLESMGLRNFFMITIKLLPFVVLGITTRTVDKNKQSRWHFGNPES